MGDRLKIFNVNSYSSFSFLRLVLRLSIFLYTFSLTLYSLIRVLYYFLYNSSSSLHFLKNYCLYFYYYCILYYCHFLYLLSLKSCSSLFLRFWYYYYCRSLRFILCLRLVFWKSIHLEVASGPFCLLVNSPWLLVFALCIFFLSLSGFNLYCWRGIHFSWSNSLIFLVIFSNLLFSFHFWFRDLLRELAKKYEILLMVLFLLFFLFLASEAL